MITQEVIVTCDACGTTAPALLMTSLKGGRELRLPDSWLKPSDAKVSPHDWHFCSGACQHAILGPPATEPAPAPAPDDGLQAVVRSVLLPGLFAATLPAIDAAMRRTARNAMPPSARSPETEPCYACARAGGTRANCSVCGGTGERLLR